MGERFMIPVGEGPSASAVALVEPWACVEAAYVVKERRGLLPSGRLLVVADQGHAVRGLDELMQSDKPVVKKTVRPPEWLGWSLMSFGAVLILHACAMKKPGA